LGISLVEASEGRSVFERFSGPNGNTITSEPCMEAGSARLLDSALGCAVQTVLPGDCRFAMLGLLVRF
jgi:hypothetical protein